MIVTNAAGCGSHLKDHGIPNVVDVSELLVDPPARAERQPLALRVAFQDSCHLKHAQRIESEPRAALQAIPGLELLEPAEQELCCGSAGIYNLVQPDAARELGDRKADARARDRAGRVRERQSRLPRPGHGGAPPRR